MATVLFERDRELAALHGSVAEAAGRHGAVVLIAGEAGISGSGLVGARIETSATSRQQGAAAALTGGWHGPSQQPTIEREKIG